MRLALSLLLTGALVLVAAFLIVPPIADHHYLDKLVHDDFDERNVGASYLQYFATRRPSVIQGAIDRLDVESDARFMDLANQIDLVGHWSREEVGDAVWFRFIRILGEDPDPESRIVAIEHLLAMSNRADDPRLIDLLRTHLEDDDADVRYNALIAAATLEAAASKHREAYHEMIATCARDDEAELARRAWMLIALLPERLAVPTMTRETLEQAPVRVAEVMAWASARLKGSSHIRPAAIVADPSLDMRLRQMAAAVNDASGVAALTDLLQGGPEAVTQENQVLVWRAMRAMPAGDAMRQVAGRFIAAAPSKPIVRPVELAALHRVPTLAGPAYKDPAFVRLAALARAEGAGPASLDVAVEPDWPALIQLAHLRAAPTWNQDDLYLMLTHPDPEIRDIACVLAASRLEPAAESELVRRLLTDFNDRAKMSGGIIAGLTDVRPVGLEGGVARVLLDDPDMTEATLREMDDASLEAMGLRKRDLLDMQAEFEDRWEVRVALQLGQWMRDPGGRDDPSVQAARAMLTREDLPRTTIMLAMLDAGVGDHVLDTLLNPKGEATVDLAELLIDKRWLNVLEPFLPDDAPTPWLWVDRPYQEFQIELLRDWWLLQRTRDRDVLVTPFRTAAGSRPGPAPPAADAPRP